MEGLQSVNVQGPGNFVLEFKEHRQALIAIKVSLTNRLMSGVVGGGP